MRAVVLLISLCWCQLTPAQSGLPDKASAILREAKMPDSAISAFVLPIDGTAPRLAHQADRPMSTASVMKVLTTAVALDELGPTYRWRTQLLAERMPDTEWINGNLYLRGGGDPNLTWQRLQTLQRDLRAMGVKHWRGDLVLDRSVITPSRPDLGVPPFDESPDAYYNVIPDTLLIHNNLLSVRLQSDANTLRSQLITPLQGVQIVSTLTLNDDTCANWDDKWVTPTVERAAHGNVVVTLSGSFPRNCKIDAAANVLDRNLFIERLWRALWQELGGSWHGKVRDGQTPASATVLAELSSDTLADIVKVVNKRSDNTMARLLLLTLGQQHPQAKTYANHLEAGRARVLDWMRRHDIDTTGAVIDNGSGLSRIERLSARQLAQVLQAASRSPWYPELAVGLPIVGVDGAMRRRLAGTPAQDQARIKTGGLRDTASVAGFVRDAHGQLCAVVAILNDPSPRRGRDALDAVIEWTTASSAPSSLASPP